MMLTIHGLPLAVKYHDLKLMIKEKCNISDYILDNLVSDGDGTKKVRIGLADEREGTHLIKCLDGTRIGPNLLRVVPVGKAPPSNPSNFDNNQRYPPRNDYPNQSSNYGNSMARPEPMHDQGRDPWGQNQNQWSDQAQGQSYGGQGQNHGQNQNYNYNQQSQGVNNPAGHYGQQAAPQTQRTYELRDQFPGRAPPQDSGYGYGAKSSIPDATAARRAEPRSHVLRSVEIIDEPLQRPVAAGYHAPQKPMTIMKDNFQGPQYNLDRQPNQPGQFHGSVPSQGHDPGHLTQGPGHGHPMGGSGSSQIWSQPMQQKPSFAKPNTPAAFDRKFPEPDKRQVLVKPIAEPPRNLHDQEYRAPRFSPRRDVLNLAPGERMAGNRMSPGRRMPSSGRRMPSPGGGRRMPSPGRRMPSPGRRILSPGRRMPSPGRRMPSPGRRMPSPGRRMSSPGRRMPSPGRRMPSPGKRMPSPGRRMPSPGRRMPSPGRRMPSPSGRRMPSPGRRMSPSGKRMSPGRRVSPGDRRMGAPRGGRYSPGPGKPPEPRPPVKDVRPAYDTPQTFSAGYRPSLHENVQYPIPGLRQPERPAWADKGFKKDDERRETPRGPKFEPRIEEAKRKSRSPLRRERSPPRDRFKKHSPSPRSPRRSWALEKRRSPDLRDAPPPPMWPGQSRDDDNFRQTRFDDDKTKRVPIWEARRPEDERRFDDARRREVSPRGNIPYKDDRFPPRDPKFEPRESKFEREPKFEPRDPKFEPRDPKFEPRGPKFEPRDPKFEPRGPKFEPRDPKFEPREPKFEPRESKFEPREPKFEPREPKFEPRVPKFEPRESKFEPRDPKFESREPKFEAREEFRRPERDFRDTRATEDPRDSARFKENFPREGFRREEERKLPKIPEINKEFEDVYKRAQELNKRADELRRREDRHRDGQDKSWKYEPHDARDRHDPKRHDTGLERKDSQKAKKEKAVDEIVSKILEKHGGHLNGDIRKRAYEELKLAVLKILTVMFGNDEVSFIEMIVKFNSKVNAHEELKMFNDVMSSFPSQYRKRVHDAPIQEVPPKTSRLSPAVNRERRFARPLKTQYKIDRRPQVTNKPNVDKPRAVKSSEDKPVRAAKPVTTKTDSKSSKEEPPVKKIKKDVPTVEMNPDGYYELNPVTSKVLEDELQQIMIQMWQELPDEPLTEAEAVVADTIRNAAGDDIRKVLGLNLTKRLLNVHNPFYVYVTFSRKPEGMSFKKFLQWMGCVSLRKVPEPGYRYSAQLPTVAHYDRVCAKPHIKYKDLTIKISPEHNFTDCPSRVKTIYKKSKAVKAKSHETENKESKKVKDIEKADTNTDKKPEVNTQKAKIVAKAETEIKRPSPTNNEEIKTTPTTTETQVKANANENKQTVAKTEPTAKPTNATPTGAVSKSIPTPTKPVATSTNSTAASVPTNTVATTAKTVVTAATTTVAAVKTGASPEKTVAPVKTVAALAETTVTPAKTVATPAKTTVDAKTVETSAKTTPPTKTAATPAKTGAPAKITATPAKVATTSKKAVPNVKTATSKTVVTPAKTLAKTAKLIAGKVTPKGAARSKTRPGKKERQPSDFDELDDEDILALMSNAVVLDECSGSDEEL